MVCTFLLMASGVFVRRDNHYLWQCFLVIMNCQTLKVCLDLRVLLIVLLTLMR
jgi:hypothetical protein